MTTLQSGRFSFTYILLLRAVYQGHVHITSDSFRSVSQNYTVCYEHTFPSTFMLSISLKKMQEKVQQ